MSSPAVQLSFALRTSPNVKTVHLLGSWDGYKAQLPLSQVKDTSAKPGSWKGTFRFQGAHALKLGSRYWYYYIVDGYHVSHDPAKEHVVEKTTGRKLNILNVPGKTVTPISTKTTAEPALKSPRSIPQGRALSPSRIVHPRPQKPHASRGLREADYEQSPVDMDDLEAHLSATRLSDRHYASSPSELSETSEASGKVFSSASGSSSSATSDEESDRCKCNRFGVTRDGRRVMLDCGGKRCGYSSEDSSECDSDDEEVDRQAEIRRRARAQLEAERARNGVKTQSARHAPVAASRRK